MASAYSREQIELYEEYVSLPGQYRIASKPTLGIEYLTALHVHQISSVPYENLTLHYSSSHVPSLNPQALFKKIVTNKRGRGGYCMECSLFFNHVLRALGFTVYTAGVRVRARVGGIPVGDYKGWFHIVNIVTLPSGIKYMMDVGFGGDGATKPLPLISGHSVQNLGTQEIRLVFDTIPQLVDKSKPLWIYQYRNGPEQEWNSFYCFPELEFLPYDFEIMNYYTSTNMGEINFQTKTVLVIRFLRGKLEGREEQGIVGKVMLVNGTLKRNDGGKTRAILVCKNESERVDVLKKHLGIELTDEEAACVKGRNVELLED